MGMFTKLYAKTIPLLLGNWHDYTIAVNNLYRMGYPTAAATWTVEYFVLANALI